MFRFEFLDSITKFLKYLEKKKRYSQSLAIIFLFRYTSRIGNELKYKIKRDVLITSVNPEVNV